MWNSCQDNFYIKYLYSNQLLLGIFVIIIYLQIQSKVKIQNKDINYPTIEIYPNLQVNIKMS